MVEEDNILRIVKEDILRILGEEKKKVSMESIKKEIRVSHSYIFDAINALEKENLIHIEGDFIKLTDNGQDRAKYIVEKHLVLENYFKRTKNKKEAHEHAHILEHYIFEEVIKNIKKISTFKESGAPLTGCKLHKEVMISDITIPGNDLFERIISMGIFPGEKIMLTNKIPGSVIVRIGYKKLAIGKDIAKEIKILEHY